MIPHSPLSRCLAGALLFSALTVVSCKKTKPPHTQAPAAMATGPSAQAGQQPGAQKTGQIPGPDDAPPSKWTDMSHAEQMVYMQEVVTPHMAKLFQEFDAQEFAQFNCGTCHGPSAAQGNFEMPNAALPRLGDFEVAKQEHPKGMAFMIEKVTPQMAELLHMPAFDPKTQKGFGCFGCHLPAQAAG